MPATVTVMLSGMSADEQAVSTSVPEKRKM